MTQTADADLHRRVEALLEPGEIQLNGLVLHTDLTTDEEAVVHERTVAVGEISAEHATGEDTYIYPGNDEPEFGLNQHQGLT